MDNESKHTPTPWKVSGKLPYIVATTSPPYRLDGTTIISRGNETGGQDWPAISKKEREANAEHIVHCVNTHATLVEQRDALLEACIELVKVICAVENLPKDGSGDEQNWREMIKTVHLAEAAIAKVEDKL